MMMIVIVRGHTSTPFEPCFENLDVERVPIRTCITAPKLRERDGDAVIVSLRTCVTAKALFLVIDSRRLDYFLDRSGPAPQIDRDAVVPNRKTLGNTYAISGCEERLLPFSSYDSGR
jgi:hypothetical protein